MKSQILATLAYSDIFDYPLKKEEIWQWMIINQLPISNYQFPIKRNDFEEAINQLLQKKLIGVKNRRYFLRGREEIVRARKQKEKWSEEKVKIAEKVAATLRLIPWIKLIGITGGLARNNSKRKDDIDLFFITAKNRLWLTRGIIVLILSVTGLYRRPNKVANMICPNMLVAEDNLKMEPQDLFMAHEVCLMKPIFVRDNFYQKFLKENLWVKRYLPNTKRQEVDQVALSQKSIFNFQFSIFNYAERLARRIQLWYMRQRRTTEVVSDNLIKFHPQDARGWILREYQARLQKFSS